MNWKIGTHPDAKLVNKMLEETKTYLSGEAWSIIHSDRGAHYRWPGWTQNVRIWLHTLNV
ncbi:hypothetical protein [Lactovum miscens]|uniref:hypothetical protein n=1 Tax=Lactovum miscens TaxID=190387 RepID=UPI002EDB36F9